MRLACSAQSARKTIHAYRAGWTGRSNLEIDSAGVSIVRVWTRETASLSLIRAHIVSNMQRVERLFRVTFVARVMRSYLWASLVRELMFAYKIILTWIFVEKQSCWDHRGVDCPSARQHYIIFYILQGNRNFSPSPRPPWKIFRRRYLYLLRLTGQTGTVDSESRHCWRRRRRSAHRHHPRWWKGGLVRPEEGFVERDRKWAFYGRGRQRPSSSLACGQPLFAANLSALQCRHLLSPSASETLFACSCCCCAKRSEAHF